MEKNCLAPESYLLPLRGYIDQRRDTLISVSDQIWAKPELKFQEHFAAKLLIATLKAEGFEVTENVCGLETGFIGEWGEDGPVIAFLGEFDALPGLSQKAGLAQYCPLDEEGNGHGCGHNLLGAGALAAALATRDYLKENGLSGVVRYYGCPAEEGGGGKVKMVEGGAFDGVDCALTWHPSDAYLVPTRSTLATTTVDFHFTGESAHAAFSPQSGRSALDAVELMNVGANFLREHIPTDMRLHYAITDSGGKAPNVVQARATVRYQLRAPHIEQIEEVYPRLCQVAEGAALMTGTKVHSQREVTYRNVIPNKTILRRMFEHQRVIGLPAVTEEELEFARQIQESLRPEAIEKHRIAEVRGKVVADAVLPWVEEMGLHMASTDVGDVSWVVPTVEYRSATWAVGTTAHTWQVTSQGMCTFAHNGMLHAAHLLAATAIDLMLNPQLIVVAKDELKSKTHE